MQRQSLGSPSPRIHIHGRGEGGSIEISSASPSISPLIVPCAVDDDDLKLKPRRSSSPPILRTGAEKFIHVIPIFTLLCFLVLFLCSHEPSPTELADFGGFKHPSHLAGNNAAGFDLIDSREIDQFEGGLDKSEMLAIGSLRNLQEITSKSSRSHRKLGDF